jgi:hypothetical protein
VIAGRRVAVVAEAVAIVNGMTAMAVNPALPKASPVGASRPTVPSTDAVCYVRSTCAP